MEQYIPKSVVLAELERRRDAALMRQRNLKAIEQESVINEMIANELNKIISLINTLEVKEVDLEKELDSMITPELKFHKALPSLFDVAKHFFELGIQTRTDKELVEEVYSHIDSIKDTADRMTSGNFMHNRAAIKFSANTITKVLELMGLKAQKGE